MLVALWLPAVLHCTALSAGMASAVDCCGGDFSAADSHGQSEADHCEMIEEGAPRKDSAGIAPPASSAVVIELVRSALGVAADQSPGVSPRAAAPPEIAGLWRAVERVVALAQAP